METPWKSSLCVCIGLLCCQLCNGLPINLENTVADSHTQLLTGLVAVLLTVCSVVFLLGCLCCQRKNGFKEFRDSPVVASTASNLDHGHINPVANGEFTIFTPLSPPHQNNNVFLANQQTIARTQDDYTYGDVDVSSWFNEGSDFPRIKLKYIKEIGKGWFGRVVEGAAQDVVPHQKWTPVVVRILEATASTKERVVFLHDASIYRCDHPNILRLIGRCLDTIPLLLLQEFCPQGDLKNYLRQNQSTADKILSSEYPLLWCCQLASALNHLHNKKLTHPDMAARNCQLTADLTLKLGDYGLAVFQYPDDYYQGAPGVSVRWCAPETITYTSTTIQPNKVTSDANIWSLGVTMWEICECGQQPYAHLSDDDVITQVLGSPSVRLSRPTCQVLYTDYMYRLMQLCWSTSESRPSVSQISLMLADLLQVYKHTNSSSQTPEDFDKRWELFKPNSIVKTDNHVDEPCEIDDVDVVVSKPLSPSLNNLHGSLDNLLVEGADSQMESWLENIANKTGDMSYVRGLSDAIKDLDNALALENSSGSDSSHRQSPAVPCDLKSKTRIEFKLGPVYSKSQSIESSTQNDSLLDSTQRNSSGSETEEENWKKKIERGAYSEKVRQKSRSVADLMILTHIDHSESESETPLPSIDYRINYKNVRYAPKQNLENVSLMFGSEGNLLNVKDTFQQELRKLKEERKDSLLFVPENRSHSDSVAVPNTNSHLDDSPTRRIMQELNSTSEMVPANQVFNVFNVTVNNFSPVLLSPKLNEIMFTDVASSAVKHEVPKLSDIIQKNATLVDYLNAEINYDSGVEDGKVEHSPDNESIKSEEPPVEVTNDADDKDEITLTPGENLSIENIHIMMAPPVHKYQVPKLVDIIQDNDDLMDYIIAKYETETLEKANNDANSATVEKNSNTKDCSINNEANTPDGNGTDSLSSLSMPTVAFDLSQEQDQMIPNSLTHSTMFASTPYGKKSLQEISALSDQSFTSLNLFSESPHETEANITNLYSLETWDNFLDNTLNRNESQEENFFDSFSSEPRGLLYVENDNLSEDSLGNSAAVLQNGTEATFVVDSELNTTYDVPQTKDADLPNEENANGTWEDNGGGWFLHPQSNSEDMSGEIASVATDTYVGFNMDDEIMTAIRNELLNKLPQAQGGSSGVVHDDEEWETSERNEVFLRYNVYNTPLSPIPEESMVDDSFCEDIRQQSEDDDSDWSEHCDEPELPPHDTESPSAHTLESPAKGPHHRHTPSQDSCCSNDTLFNLEDLTCVLNDTDKDLPLAPLSPKNESPSLINEEDSVVKLDEIVIHVDSESTQDDTFIVDSPSDEINPETSNVVVVDNEHCTPHSAEESAVDKTYITEFLANERVKTADESNSESSTGDNLLPFCKKQVAPLPSPEDKPWKQLAVSLMTSNKLLPHAVEAAPVPEPESQTIESQETSKVPDYENIDDLISRTHDYDNIIPSSHVVYENIASDANMKVNTYETVTDLNDIYNEADYVNIVNLENTKNSAEFCNGIKGGNVVISADNGDSPDTHDYVNSFDACNELIIDSGENERDVFGVLTDIRFNGPGDTQLMTTSFSESNDLNDEQDWDSGSDTRSSSSGEFIWKEGEHEESLKALRAAPQDVLEDIKPLEEIQEETSSESSGSDEEGESPEFVPSAWDKYAIPTKSALRSPEKTIEKTDKKKSKGVWFKKQKYHCVYEYPREPDSPVLHSYDLWKPQQDFSSFTDWELDASDSYIPPVENSEDFDITQNPKSFRTLNLYQLSTITDFASSGMDDEFFISSSSKPFDNMSGVVSSQFFPGNWSDPNKPQSENMTPDSGVEDITPGDFENKQTGARSRTVPPLKVLASEIVNRNKKVDDVRNSDVLGGLRHTRNKLKLDLPPSPSAFTSNRMFNIEPVLDPVVSRERPTFTTFGKSRFMVQHVDTPPDEEAQNKNVSFEALPYKPMHLFNDSLELGKYKKGKIEMVRGEASLLDSADEDSGIESSTLERKLSAAVE